MSGLPRICANISTLYRELPMLERFDAARAGGFDGIEIQFPYAESPTALTRAAEASGLPVVLINAPIVPREHPYGIAAKHELCALFREQLPQLEEYAQALRPRFVHVLAGCVDTAADRRACLQTYLDNLALAIEVLRPLGIGVLIEPLNPADAPGYFLGSFELARSILSRGLPGVGLQFDAYHATRMGLDLTDELALARPYLGHMQFADVPGRREPGSGSVRFKDMLGALLDADYAGWLGAEYFPAVPTRQSLGWLSEWRDWMSARRGGAPRG